MKVEVDVHLTRVFCLQPNDEHGDEPYLWNFFFKVDGDTVKQAAPGGDALLGSVTVTTGPLNHGNLGAEDVMGNAIKPLLIPAVMGDFSATLRPIRLSRQGLDTIIPGQLIVISVVADEDSTLNSSAEAAHEDLRVMFEGATNTFIANLDLGTLLADATARQAGTSGGIPAAAEAVFLERLDAALAAMSGQARGTFDAAILTSKSTIGILFDALIDDDELLSATPIRFDARALLAMAQPSTTGPLVFRSGVRHNLVSSGKWQSFYTLEGGIDARVVGPGLLPDPASTLAIAPWMMREGRAQFPTEALCVPAGEPVPYTLLSFVETLVFVCPVAPFFPFIWSVDGVDLTDPSPVTVPGTTCGFPFFDTTHPSGPSLKLETRAVRIAFAQSMAGPLSAMTLKNFPTDGNYMGIIAVDAVIPTPGTPAGTRIRVAAGTYAFDGQRIVSPFYDQYEECIDKYDLGERAKSKRVGPKDLWGPFGRHLAYQEQLRRADQLAAAGLMSRTKLEVIKTVLRQRLGEPQQLDPKEMPQAPSE